MYGRVTGSGDSCSPPLHSSVRENYSSFRFAVQVTTGGISVKGIHSIDLLATMQMSLDLDLVISLVVR